MEGPSVLDYLKSKLRFWKRDEIIPTPDEPALTPEPISIPLIKRIPWFSLLTITLALTGQRSFEPAIRNYKLGIFLYAISLGLLIIAIRKGEWRLAPIQDQQPSFDGFSMRKATLLPAVLFALAAFALFRGNLFNGLNVTLWVLAIFFLFRAFWLPAPDEKPLLLRIKQFLQQEHWQIQVTRWGLLVIGVVAIVLFFRLFRLGGVPAEPFSDHAEKIQDIYDVTQGQFHIFFPRNTGREAFQMYLTVLVAWIFGTGLTFLSLKIGTVICGLVTLPYMYLLGKEIGDRKVGLLAVLVTGMAYWPNVISRVGLRFPLYPLFVAPVLFYLIRGLRKSARNDFIKAGLFLGLGLHGYSPYRIMPVLVLVGVGLFWMHRQSMGNRSKVLIWLVLLAMTSLFIFLPLLRYWLDDPQTFAFRAFSRLGSVEQPLNGIWWKILLTNTWNAFKMFNISNGETWVHSVPYRPALDLVTAALFILGLALLVIRYFSKRNWQDLFLILSIPILLLPSILSLAFPAENPALNRTSGAYVPVFILVALALDGLMEGIKVTSTGKTGKALSIVVVGILLFISASQNFDLVFRQYDQQFRMSSWNSSEMGAVIRQFGITYGSTNNAWVVPYPYWVDTRLPGVWAGIPNRDFGVWPAQLTETQAVKGVKLFIFNLNDSEAVHQLETIYPKGTITRFVSKTPAHDFMIDFVPAQ